MGDDVRSTLFWILFFLCYIAFISWNIYKLRDIRNNPQKYKKVKGAEEYQKSLWFEIPSKSHGKHYWASLIVTHPIFLIFCVISFCVPSIVQKILFISADFVLLQSPGVMIGTIGAIFLSIALLQFVLFSINKPIFVAARLYWAGCTVKSDSDDYLKAWKKTILVLLVMGIICLPILAIGINAYSYADEEKIVTHGVFSLQEKQIPYDMVISRETSYSYDEEDDTFEFQYIIVLSDGKEMDLYDFGPRGVCYIDTMLNRHNVIISHGRVDKDTYEQMKSVCDEMSLKFVDQCLIVDG